MSVTGESDVAAAHIRVNVTGLDGYINSNADSFFHEYR